MKIFLVTDGTVKGTMVYDGVSGEVIKARRVELVIDVVTGVECTIKTVDCVESCMGIGVDAKVEKDAHDG